MEKKEYFSPVCMASIMMRSACIICVSGDDQETLPPGAGPDGGVWEGMA